MIDLWIAVVLGIVEGLTEFLPVSSTGHLIVSAHLLGYTGNKASCFEVFIQLGAILAVVVLYWRRFVALIPSGSIRIEPEQGFHGWRGLLLLAATTLPALAIGALAHGAIKTYLFNPLTVALALGAGGVAILLVERFRPEPQVTSVDGLNLKTALIIGCFQCLAMWPGVSRSAATIIGGLLVRLDRPTAAEYSFLAAVPVMLAATAFDFYQSFQYLSAEDATFFAVGFGVSFISAILAVETFIRMVQRWSLAPFAWYRLAIAPVIYFVWL